MNKKIVMLALTIVLLISVISVVPITAKEWKGYDWKAGIFVGTYAQWCSEKYNWDPDQCVANFLGDAKYLNDKIVMKWNDEWDRGSTEGWKNGPYTAWLDNEINGRFNGGSGENWHYKIKWIGTCTDYTQLPDGGYCIWGEFEVLMDHGMDPNLTALPFDWCTANPSGHMVCALAKPNGYGT